MFSFFFCGSKRERTEIRLFQSLYHESAFYPFHSNFIQNTYEERLVCLTPFVVTPLISIKHRKQYPDAHAYSIHACLPVRHINLLTLAYQISSSTATLSVVYTTRGLVSSRVWLREMLPISNAHYPLSCATCDINLASVSSLSWTECSHTAIYTSVPYPHRAFVA